MADYQGTNFLELVEEPILNYFGEVEIELQGCNELTATVTTDGQNHDLNLSRINNTTYDKFCLDRVDQ